MNRLPAAKRAQMLQMLCEGNSMRSVSRMTDTSINTVSKLLVDAGRFCQAFHDEMVRGVNAKRVQADEIWSFVAKKQRHLTAADDPQRVGDMWTFVALDADTKLVPCYRIGKRDLPTASAFMTDLSDRLANRVQLSSDALAAYAAAAAFSAELGLP